MRTIRSALLAGLLLTLLAATLPPAAGAETLALHGTVVELGETHFAVRNAEGKVFVVRLTPASGYVPADYRPALEDEVNVRCFVGSRITRRLYLIRVDFVKENFKPAIQAE